MKSGLAASLALLVLACLPAALTAAPSVVLPSIAVRLLPGTDSSILQQLEHVRLAKATEPVVLALDLAHKRVLNGAGRVVAGPDSVGSIYLQSVVDKWRYVAALSALARAHPQELQSEWGDDGTPQAAPRPWISGTTAIFVVPHVPPQRYVMLFGMGPRGDIYFLELQQAGSEDMPGDTLVVRARAIPPFGAEHLVAVTSTDLPGIRSLATWLAETAQSSGLIDTQGEVLKQLEGLKDVRIGFLASYTCRTAPECVK